jgi:subtilisin family serine protease
LVLGAVAIVAMAAVACIPPPPPPPPPAICGVTATASAAAEPGQGSGDAATSEPTGQYVAVVERNGRSKVLTRKVDSPAEIEQFRADAAAQGEVTAFEPDGELHAFGEAPSWGFAVSGFNAAWGSPAATGGGVRVAELDTGIDIAQPDLDGHFDGTSADIVVSNAPTHLEPAQPAIDPPPVVTTDLNGHGTHVAGILGATAGNDLGVAGGAPGVTLVPVRVLDASGSGDYSDVAAGILWAADVAKGNAQVITMSLGGSTSSSVVTQAIATALDPTNANYTHPVFTVAAGNGKCAKPSFPASLASTTPEMLPVSGLCFIGINTTTYCPNIQPWPADGPYRLGTYSSKVWNTSSSVPPRGISAPGTEIKSTLPGGLYGLKSGTSMATPFVAAAAALVIGHCPADTAAQVVARLQNSAHDLGPTGPDALYGNGRLDAAAAVQSC